MTTILNRQPNSDLAHATRAAQRKLKQLEIEKEQRMEEVEALKMTEEQRQILQRSFSSVKVEFSDLDGLSWRQKPQAWVNSPEQPFVVLTNADLASFGPHETIRASASSRPRPRTSISSPNISSRPLISPPQTSPTLTHAHSTSLASLSSSTETITAILNKHLATRSRSPIKGLFPSDAYESDSERTVRGSDSDLDDSPRPKKERKKNRASKTTVGSVRGVLSSPSALAVSARSVIKRLANANKNANVVNATASPKAGPRVPTVAHPQTNAYPAYITYSKPAQPVLSPSPQTRISSATSCPDIPYAAKTNTLPFTCNL
ncbi:hypothetical protein C0991_001550 [Blastosporella zonata]|nr:hypothetical protein C0991_001550 [Blastosporella zonata]